MPFQTIPVLPTSTAGLSPEQISELSQYHYIPTGWICILFIVLFTISGVLHIGQAVHYRMSWLFITVIAGAVGEVIGWVGRLWSNRNIFLGTPFKMQLVALVIAPTPLLAAIFVILGHVIQRLGPQYSRMSPRWYSIIFVSCDVAALLLQAAGGAAASGTSKDIITLGSHLLLAGIAFQLGAMTVFIICATEFLLRYYIDRPARHVIVSKPSSAIRGVLDGRLKLMIISITLSTLFLFVRAIYRTIELAYGWTGSIIRVQSYFDGMDGAMIVLALYTLNFLHPGFLLPPTRGRLDGAVPMQEL